MALRREQRIYENWELMKKRGYRSKYFHAPYQSENANVDLKLSERLLFTQSNARVLLGQDCRGRLTFICAPSENDFMLPTGVENAENPITAYPGMYAQTDVALWLGKAYYSLEMDDGRMFPAIDEDGETWYLDHFLPTSESSKNGLEMQVISLAPVMEKGAHPFGGIPGTPLPGPSGAVYAAVLKNNGKEVLSGKCHLHFDKNFVIRGEHTTEPFENDCLKPYHCEWERNIYTMWRPDASVAIHLACGVNNYDAENPEMYVPFEICPGEEVVIQSRIAVTPQKSQLSEAMAILLQHDALEWVNATADFWQTRLGKLEVTLDGPKTLSEKYRDFRTRCILDNFNCLQMDRSGRLLVHWQGAPSHNLGRFWGIDIEPTVNSLLYILPEIGPSALLYIMNRNEPRYSVHQDHSTAIRVSLLIIAGKYLQLTGDKEFFRKNGELMQAIHASFRRLMQSKHEKYALFSSRYSSDGIVFHRYDVGTNGKVWLALKGYRELLEALGLTCEVDLQALMDQLQRDMLHELVEEGPFGLQFVGGKTYGEDREQYFRDDIFYYDGEDSTSCMFPVYGICGYREPAWVNYHRFARSLFASNYDAEMQSLRWYFYGAAVDGSAYISALGGSVTRAEMRQALTNMFESDVDCTGSLYWWPKGTNRIRCVSRCSQGQGSWLIQDTEQWMGLKYDAGSHELTICPRGLVSSCKWENVHIGTCLADMEWTENAAKFTLKLRNKNQFSLHVKVGIRSENSGCEGHLQWQAFEIRAGEWAEKQWPICPNEGFETANIVRKEREKLQTADQKEIFDAVGMMMPSAEQPINAFMLSYVWIPSKEYSSASIRLTVPEKWGVAAKERKIWPKLEGIEANEAEIQIQLCPPKERIVAPFFIRLPENAGREEIWSSIHPFAYPEMEGPHKLYGVSRSGEKFEDEIRAVLTYRDADGENRIEKVLPIVFLNKQEYKEKINQFMYGKLTK